MSDEGVEDNAGWMGAATFASILMQSNGLTGHVTVHLYYDWWLMVYFIHL